MGMEEEIGRFLLLLVFRIAVFGILYWYVGRLMLRRLKTRAKQKIALVLLILIPTWDIILGYGVYVYTCLTQGGSQIYQPIGQSDGFFAGERQRYNEKDFYLVPHRGFAFIDYKVKNAENGQYLFYRDAWSDANSTDKCQPINMAIFEKEDLNRYKQGQCIVHREIKESEVSPVEYYRNATGILGYFDESLLFKNSVLNIRIDSLFSVVDRKNGKKLAEYRWVSWQGGWIQHLLWIEPEMHCPMKDSAEDDFLAEVFGQSHKK